MNSIPHCTLKFLTHFLFIHNSLIAYCAWMYSICKFISFFVVFFVMISFCVF